MGTRTVYVIKPEGELQFLVFRSGLDALSDPDAKHVLGSGFSEAHALESARRSLELEAMTPENYQPRLKGCSFVRDESTKELLIVDPAGQVLGRGTERLVVTNQAMHALFLNAQEPYSFDEFCGIAVVASLAVERSGRGRGQKTYGSVFADHVGQDAVTALVKRAYRGSEVIREGAAAEAKKQTSVETKLPARSRAPKQGVFPKTEHEVRQEREILALLNTSIKSMLSSFSGGVLNFSLSAKDGSWGALVILHDTHRSDKQMLAIAHQQYLSEFAEQNEAPRERSVA